MFSIGFINDHLIEVDLVEECVGLIALGSCEERFIAHMLNWSEQEYSHHWKRALVRALASEPSALVTDMLAPTQSSHLVWWPMWRIHKEVVFHNQLLFFGKHKIEGPLIDPEQIYGLIGNYAARNDEGTPLSEWRVPVRDVETFLRLAG